MYPLYNLGCRACFANRRFWSVYEIFSFSQYVILNVWIDIRMDVRDMSGFESGSFDAVIDKGTLSSSCSGFYSTLPTFSICY